MDRAQKNARRLARRDRERARARPHDPAVRTAKRLAGLVERGEAVIAVASARRELPLLVAMRDEDGRVVASAVPPAELPRLRERALRHVDAATWDAFLTQHDLDAFAAETRGTIAISTLTPR